MPLQRRKANNPPVNWSPYEENILLDYLIRGESNLKKIRKLFPNRTNASIRSKVRKLKIKYDLFGNTYRDIKGNFTAKIAAQIRPDVVFEAYAGAGHQTIKWIKYCSKIYTSDKSLFKKDQFFSTMQENGFENVWEQNNWFLFRYENKEIYFFFGDAIDAAAHIRIKKIKIDVLDLDTCGSTLPLLPTLLVLCYPKYLMITHGEFHSLRFKREDVLRRILFHRNANESPLPMTVDQLSLELDKSVKIAALRANNETESSFWPELLDEIWLGSKAQGMLRRFYKLEKPSATSDCLNYLENT